MRYIMVARILLILPVFSFVLAAPVPVRKVPDAYADAVDVDENVIIVSRKRADPYIDSEWDRSDPEWLTWTPSTKPSSASDASGSSDGVPSPSSSPTGSKLPLNPLSTPGETKMPLDPEGALKSGSTTEIQPASSSGTKSVSWGHTTKVTFPNEEILVFPPPAKVVPATVTKTQSNGLASIFSKLGKLRFWPRL
jgi:hypothetical protein